MKGLLILIRVSGDYRETRITYKPTYMGFHSEKQGVHKCYFLAVIKLLFLTKAE